MNRRMMIRFRHLISSTLVLFFGLSAVSAALADGPAVPAGTAAPTASPAAALMQPNGPMQYLPFVLMFVVLYFMILRPQQKKMKEQQAMLAALKHGDEVLTASGFLGKVAGITDKVVTIDLGDQVKVKMLKSQVSQVVKGSIQDISLAN